MGSSLPSHISLSSANRFRGWRSMQFLCISVVLGVLSLGACASGSGDPGLAVDNKPRTKLGADVARLRGPDGLLFPPEIWSVVDYSGASEVLYTLVRRVSEPDFGWVSDREKLTKKVGTEIEQRTEAEQVADLYWAGQLGLTIDAPQNLQSIVDAAAKNLPKRADLATLHQALWLADNADGGRPQLDANSLTALEKLSESKSPIVSWRSRKALEILGETQISTDNSTGWIKTDHPALDEEDVFSNFYAWVELNGKESVDSVDRDAWRVTCGGPKGTDEDFYFCAAAFAKLGISDGVDASLASFDPRRVEMGTGVLNESPLFNGSLGSTERVIRYLVTKQGAGKMSPDVLASLPPVDPIRNALDTDLSSLVAGTAILSYLDPAGTPESERQEVIDKALASEVPPSGRLNLDEVMAWVSISDAASAMDVPVEPRLGDDDAHAELMGDDDEALYALVRYVRAWISAGGSAAEIEPVATHMRASLASREIAELPTLLLFGGALAVRDAGLDPVFSDSQLRAEAKARTGECRGGFTTFLREYRQKDSVCNIDASRLAAELEEE